jgi:HD-GYP domain-containing protein (c-di-GMP phosphodiesterase class II)
MTLVERTCLRRLGVVKLALGAACMAPLLIGERSAPIAAPVLLGVPLTFGGAGLLGAAAARSGPAVSRLAAIGLEFATLAALPHAIAAGAVTVPAWFHLSWLPLAALAAVIMNAAAAPARIAAAAGLAGFAAGWVLGEPTMPAIGGAAAFVAALTLSPCRHPSLLSAELSTGLAHAVIRARSRVGGPAAPAERDQPPVDEAALRAAAAMLHVTSLALLVHERTRRLRVLMGHLHVVHQGTHRLYRVALDRLGAEEAERPDRLGFVQPAGFAFARTWRAKRLHGEAGELGRLIVGEWPPAPQSRAGAAAPDEALLSLLAAWWSLRLDNHVLAANAEARLLDVVESLVTSVEAKDPYTSGHSKRVCKYSLLIAEALGMAGSALDEVAIGAALHDVGKLGIPEHVLRKAGRLDAAEWELMKQHPKVGSRIIDSFNQSPAVLHMIFHHHERYDGTGYPAGLRGDAIPFHARILAVADALDAMTSGRAYQLNKTVAEALEEVRVNAGKQFDPAIVEATLRIPREHLEAIAPHFVRLDQPAAPAAPPGPAPSARAASPVASVASVAASVNGHAPIPPSPRPAVGRTLGNGIGRTTAAREAEAVGTAAA